MGAEVVIQRIKGKTADAAYRDAHEQARYEHGSGGYSGSMAESHGYFVAKVAPKLHYEATRYADKLIDTQVHKWGPTALIPLAEATAKRTIELTVDITGFENDWDKRNAAVDAAVRAKLRAGEQIDDLRSQDGESKTKIVTTATEGATVTGYAVKNARGGTIGSLHPTLTAAKKAAQEFVAKNTWDDTATITKVTLREGNKPLVVVKRTPTRTTLKVSATVGKPSSATPTQWIAAGIYSS